MNLAAAPTPEALDGCVHGTTRSAHVPPAIVLIPYAAFVTCIDTCVQSLAANVDGALEPAATTLRAWLDGNTQILETGALIDFDQFDAAILTADERVPQCGPLAQTQLLRASRALAEAVYAPESRG